VEGMPRGTLDEWQFASRENREGGGSGLDRVVQGGWKVEKVVVDDSDSSSSSRAERDSRRQKVKIWVARLAIRALRSSLT
jgi:hypothetical protein